MQLKSPFLQGVDEKMLEKSTESDEVFVLAGEEMERKGDLPEVSSTHVTSEGVKNQQPRCYNMPPVKGTLKFILRLFITIQVKLDRLVRELL